MTGVNFEGEFLRMIEEGKEVSVAYSEAIGLLRGFLRGDPDIFLRAGRAMDRLEVVEQKIKSRPQAG